MKLTERLLLEMSLEDARKLLNITSDVPLDKAFKKAALKHHPDRGGSDEMMKKVNQAYDLLKASGGGKTYSQMSDDERRAAWQEREAAAKVRKANNYKKMESMLTEFKDRFMQNVPDYSDHFSEFFKLQKPEVTSRIDDAWNGSYKGRIFVKWPTTDNATEIQLGIDIVPERNSGLSYDSDEPVYSVDYTTVLYHNRKDNKMGRRNWKWNQTSNDALDPEKVFPKAKLKKVLKKVKIDKMTRKDFERALSIELKKYKPDFRFNNIDVVFDFKREDKLWLGLMRRVMNRQPYWSIIFYENHAPEGKSPHLKWAKQTDLPSTLADARSSFPETSTSVDLLKDYLNKFIKNKKISKDHFKAAIEKQQGK